MRAPVPPLSRYYSAVAFDGASAYAQYVGPSGGSLTTTSTTWSGYVTVPTGGAFLTVGTGGSYNTLGFIGEARFYRRALSATELQKIFSGLATIVSPF